MCVCEEGLEDDKTSPWSFSSFHSQATEINLFYANLFFCYFFYIFIHLHSLFCVLSICLVEFSVTGYWFLILLLCLFSGSQMRSDEVTKSAKSGTEKLSLALQMEVVFSGFVFFFFYTALPKRRSWSCPCMKTMMEECLLVILGNFYTLLMFD